MNVEDLRDYCLALAGVTESFPFDESTLVFKVGPKIFALMSLEADPPRVNLKCDPLFAIELREQYQTAVLPGYHMNKKHWNTIVCNGELSNTQIKNMIEASYNLVFNSLTKVCQNAIL